MEFFLFLIICICSLAVIFSSSPLQSVIYLMLLYLQFVYVFFCIGADFLAISLLIVYIGALSILMLFVVMMFNLKVVDLYISNYKYIPIVIFLFLIFLFEFFFIFFIENNNVYQKFFFDELWFEDFDDFVSFYEIDNLYDISKFGDFLYNYYFVLILLLSLLLLVAMIGAIVFTMYFDFNGQELFNDFYYFGDFIDYKNI